MPEGDTIFRAARTLQRALAGRVVTHFDTQYAQLATVHDDAPITGRTIERVSARGKHLLVYFSWSGQREAGSGTGEAIPAAGRPAGGGAIVLRTHMLMSGSWHVYRPGERWQRAASSARIVIGTTDFVAVGFSIPIAEFIPAAALETDQALGRLGPDVLADDFEPDAVAPRLAASGRPTAAEALLDQQSVAGIGNVYKSELLFLARVWPFTPPAHVPPDRWRRMMQDARTLLRANVVDPHETGVVTWRGMRRTTGRSNPEQRLYVYGRRGEPCRRCGTAVRMVRHGEHNRSTYWCPSCQPETVPPHR